MSNNTQAQEAKYFDLHTTGIGYLNRIREVPIRRGEPFLAVTVAALHGAADSVEYSYIDCKVDRTASDPGADWRRRAGSCSYCCA